jgi:hypothetical protein
MPISAFPSWCLRIVSDICGKGRVVSETTWLKARIRDVPDRTWHDGCGGRTGKAQLATGLDGASGHPVRRIVLQQASTRRRGACSYGPVKC